MTIHGATCECTCQDEECWYLFNGCGAGFECSDSDAWAIRCEDWIGPLPEPGQIWDIDGSCNEFFGTFPTRPPQFTEHDGSNVTGPFDTCVDCCPCFYNFTNCFCTGDQGPSVVSIACHQWILQHPSEPDENTHAKFTDPLAEGNCYKFFNESETALGTVIGPGTIDFFDSCVDGLNPCCTPDVLCNPCQCVAQRIRVTCDFTLAPGCDADGGCDAQAIGYAYRTTSSGCGWSYHNTDDCWKCHSSQWYYGTCPDCLTSSVEPECDDICITGLPGGGNECASQQPFCDGDFEFLQGSLIKQIDVFCEVGTDCEGEQPPPGQQTWFVDIKTGESCKCFIDTPPITVCYFNAADCPDNQFTVVFEDNDQNPIEPYHSVTVTIQAELP